MRAAIFDPYLETLGGGEKYAATFAECLESLGYEVDFWWNEDFTNKLNDRFGLSLKSPNFYYFDPVKAGFWEKMRFTSKYDLIFWMSDGSLPISFAKKTLIHMQVPAHWRGCGTIGNKFKARLYPFICNSVFTKEVVDRAYGVNSQVLYPPVSVESYKPLEKKDLIVSVGRFNKILNAKRQDVLISAFKKLGKISNTWSLVIAGGSEDEEYVQELKSSIGKLNIKIVPNPTFKDLKLLMGQAKLFWSATGFEVNPRIFPEKMEHFGITTVEAMAAGVVPLVTKSGGHLETVADGKSGYLWSTLDELVEKSLELINDPKLREKFAQNSIDRSKSFSRERFYREVATILQASVI